MGQNLPFVTLATSGSSAPKPAVRLTANGTATGREGGKGAAALLRAAERGCLEMDVPWFSRDQLSTKTTFSPIGSRPMCSLFAGNSGSG
jgi:hypothetical protein